MSFFVSVRRWWSSIRSKRAFQNLIDCRFDKVWHGKNLTDFHRFLELQATPAGAFLITVELEEGGLVWFRYLIEVIPEGGAVVGSKVTMQFPKDENLDNRECPFEWKGLPVWRYLDK